MALLQAFRQARDVALDRIQGADPEILLVSWASACWTNNAHSWGENYLAHNIEDNRVVLEAMTQYAFEQGLTPEPIDFRSLFARRPRPSQGDEKSAPSPVDGGDLETFLQVQTNDQPERGA